MYIREIRVNGFTSFLSETSVGDISPGVNVIVGRNGAGKSNLFTAIRFVLADVPNKTKHDILYNGRGKWATSCRVELVIADADIPGISESQVTFGREIVANTDRYLLDGKQITKTRAQALLESSGLSYCGNAFYIVPQGEVTRLAAATDEGRLDTLLMATGAQTFEDRKQAALTTLEKADANMAECQDVLTRMEKHMNNIARDADTLRDHLELRKQVRGIEHILLTIEKLRTDAVIASETEKLEQQNKVFERLDEYLNSSETKLNDLRLQVADAEAAASEADAELQAAEQELHSRKVEAQAANTLVSSTNEFMMGGEESLTMTYNPRREGDDNLEDTFMRNGEYDHESNNEMYDSLNGRDEDGNLLSAEERFQKLKTELMGYREKLSSTSKQLTSAKTRLRNLQLKEGRGNQMNQEEQSISREEATQRVQETISTLEKNLADERQRYNELLEKISKTTQELSRYEEQSQNAIEKAAAVSTDQQIARQELSDAESARAMALLSCRKADISRERLEKTADLKSKQLLATTKASVVRGISSIRELASELNLKPSQYFGTVADLIELQPTVGYAAERVAGGQMFYHVVDNSDTVKLLVDAAEKAPMGSIGSASFVPLADVIVDPPKELVEEEGTTPLSSLVSVKDARFNKLIPLFFGKHVLCQDMQTALKYTREHKAPTVTVDGDICDPYGAISGGSSTSSTGNNTGGNNSNHRQMMIRELGKLQVSIIEMSREAAKQRLAAETAAQRVTQCIDTLNKAKVDYLRATLARQDAIVPVSEMRDLMATLSRQKDDTETSIEMLEQQLASAQQEQASFAVNDSYAGILNESEREEINQLHVEVGQLQKELDQLGQVEYQTAMLCQHAHRQFENELNTKKQQKTDNTVAEEGRLVHAAYEADQKYTQAQAVALDKRRVLDDLQKKLSDLQNHLQEAQRSVNNAAVERKNEGRKVEKQGVKIRALKGLVSDLEKRMQKLGSVPEASLKTAERILVEARIVRDQGSEALRAHQQELQTTVNDMNTEHKKLTKSLEELGDVNQRAITDFEVFSADLALLKEKHTALATERETILHTIQSLTTQKREKLDVILGRVAHHFENLFSKLSDDKDSGQLVLNRDPSTGEVTSVGINTTFGPHTTMSGGQKSLCALAIIFAVQACDPAAFYVFDEIDANLDEWCRERVANVIKTLSKRLGPQFICTTFHPELVHAGDAWIGVSFSGKESVVEHITQDMAFEFIKDGIEE